MTGTGKTLTALGLLVVTNLATFGWASWRCHLQAQGHERLLTQSSERAEALQREVADLRGQLDRLAVWREFVELQRDVSEVQAAINRLNFGDAIAGVERVEGRLARGEYGETFQQRRAELLPALAAAKEALRSTDVEARSHLADLEQRAFRLLAAVSGGGAATPVRPVLPPAVPIASPSPAPSAVIPSPAPAASPSPTARGPA